MAGKKPIVVYSGISKELQAGDSILGSDVVITGYTSAAGTVAATDSVVAAINKLNGNDGLKANIAVATGTSVALSFGSDNIQGTISSPLTGNITGSTTGAQMGVVAIVIHNAGTAPTFDSKFKKLSGSKEYAVGVINYIFCMYINSTEIIYQIQQRS